MTDWELQINRIYLFKAKSENFVLDSHTAYCVPILSSKLTGIKVFVFNPQIYSKCLSFRIGVKHRLIDTICCLMQGGVLWRFGFPNPRAHAFLIPCYAPQVINFYSFYLGCSFFPKFLIQRLTLSLYEQTNMLKELLYLFENVALVISSVQYIGCLQPLVTSKNFKRVA